MSCRISQTEDFLRRLMEPYYLQFDFKGPAKGSHSLFRASSIYPGDMGWRLIYIMTGISISAFDVILDQALHEIYQ